jgi:hypothetical protein
MTAAAPRAPLRRWFYAAYLAMSSVELGVHHTAIRYAMGTGRLVHAKLRVCATRLAPCSVPVAPTFDNQLWPRARWPSDKHDDHTGDLSCGVPRHEYARRLQPIGVTTALPPTTRLGEPAPLAMEARVTTLCFDLTAKMRTGFRSVSLTVEALTRNARPRRGQHLRGIRDGAALWQLYWRWFVPDDN